MTVLRNPDGSAIIPTAIPPAVEFPFPPASLSKEEIPDETPKSSMSRPQVDRNWQTERPQFSKRISSIPNLRRQGTNISALNNAIWNTPGYSVESDSSSEEEQTAKEAVKTKRSKKSRVRDVWTGKSSNDVVSDSRYSKFAVGNDDFSTKGRVSKKDGRLNISVNETRNRGYLAKTLSATFTKTATRGRESSYGEEHMPEVPDNLENTLPSSAKTPKIPQPRLNIVVMVIGSRGDIQPFLKIGKILKEEHGHRVRIATHPAFRDFVQKDSGLEFFSVGGDPAELMAFMVKNPGMIPKMETVRAGEIGRRREQMSEMFHGFWRACINATDDEKDINNMKMMGSNQPFVADAIIANPPCFAHIHCAERLGVPLHLMFTFPYTPTQAFPHPLANIKQTNIDPGYTNFMSYPLVEMMTWQGLGDLINEFRVNCLGLEPASTLWAPGALYRLKVPYTYLWSPGLIPKPSDWGPEIDIAGFVFLDLASSFKPPDDLAKFLEAGEPPVYIGFGSIVVDDPDRFTKMIFEAVEKAGVRALVSKGWGGLGDDNVPDNIFMLENTPHDWLFPRVSAVIHHGGAGTSAIGLKCGKPTFIVPFFGDQQFWGAMVGKAGAGPDPVPYKNLTMEKMAEAIEKCLTPEAREAAEKMAKNIELEGDGAQNAVKSFHRSLTLRGDHSMRCSILEDRVAVWRLKNTNLRLSALAADILVEKKKISWKNLRLIRHHEWNDFEGPGEPLSGITTSITGTLTGMATGVGSIPFRIAKSTKRRQKHVAKKRQKILAANRKRSDTGSDMMTNGKANGVATKGKRINWKIKKATNGNSNSKESEIPNNSNAAGEAGRAMKDTGLGQKTQRGTPVIHNNNPNTDGNEAEDENPENMAEEYAQDVAKGLGKSGEALAKAPMDLAIAIAQGFHNAPRLYGDTSVRRPVRITGMKSGLKAAGKECVFGVYDGFTGVIKQPYKGAKEDGALGFGKGVAMGLTGFVLKNIAAIIGPIGYSLKGVHRELLKSREPTHFIRKARIVQGQRDLRDCRRQAAEDAEKEGRKVKGVPVTREEEMVAHGWSVVHQVWKLLEEKRSKGIKGKIDALKTRKTWRANGAFENVEMAERALEAVRKGESLDDVFRLQREELEKSKLPRRDVVKDIEEEKAEINGEGDGGDGKGNDEDDGDADGGEGESSDGMNDEAFEMRKEEEQRKRNEMEQLRMAQSDVMSKGTTLV